MFYFLLKVILFAVICNSFLYCVTLPIIIAGGFDNLWVNWDFFSDLSRVMLIVPVLSCKVSIVKS